MPDTLTPLHFQPHRASGYGSCGALLHLPPTPAELDRVELVQRSLAVIRRGTDDVVAFVAQHAYGGFSEPVARELTRHIQETATLCRRCERDLP